MIDAFSTRIAVRGALTCFACATLLLLGCPGEQSENDGPVDVCTSAGTQCRLAPGQLGVCTMNLDGGYQCLSQH